MQKIFLLDFSKQENYFPKYDSEDVELGHYLLKLVYKLHKLQVLVIYFSYFLNFPLNIVNGRDTIPKNE